MFPLKNQVVILHSNLPLEECKSRLCENIDTSSFFKRFFFGETNGQPVGKLSDNTLTIRKYIPYRNSGQTILTAKLTSDEEGTIITCSLGLSSSVKVFLLFWFGFLCLFSLLIAIQFSPTYPTIVVVVPLLIPLTFLLFGYCFFTFCRNLAIGEDLYLL